MPSIEKNEDILSIVQTYFPQFSEPNLQREIEEVGTLMKFSGGEVIMDYGSYVKMVPLVIKGSIKVMRMGEDGEELLLYYLNAGETCSMSFSCCMMDKQSEIRTIADDSTTLIGIPIKQVDQWMNSYQSWRNFVMLSYDNRILELVKTVDSIAFKKMDERLMEYLLTKAGNLNSLNFQITHQEIAYDLNASRESVSRLLKQLEKTKKVKLGRNRIELIPRKH